MPEGLASYQPAGHLKPISTRRPVKQRDPLTPLRRKLVYAMVHQALSRNDAATAVGMSHNAAINAFHEPAVRLLYNKELDVLRTSGRARNLHVGEELRDKSASDKVRLEAAKWLHGESDRASGGGVVNVQVNVQPGYIVQVGQPSAEVQRVLELAGSTRRAPASEGE